MNPECSSPEKPVYPTLAKHQRDEDWVGRTKIVWLQDWAERLNVEFKLDIPHIVLCIGALAARTASRFHFGHNPFGLTGEIAFNSRHLGRPEHELLPLLLHELVHAWQQAHGRPGKNHHHNAEFRAKALELGLVVDPKGGTELAADGLLSRFMCAQGLGPAPGGAPEGAALPTGSSKLKKWSCGCTNVRCAIATFYAQCLKCGQVFRQA